MRHRIPSEGEKTVLPHSWKNSEREREKFREKDRKEEVRALISKHGTSPRILDLKKKEDLKSSPQ